MSLTCFSLGTVGVTLGFAGLIFYIVILAAPISRGAGAAVRAKGWGLVGFCILMGGLCVAVLLVARASHRVGEPVAFAEGISIWPTELLRLVVVWLSLAFLTQAWLTGAREKQKLEELLKSLPDHPPSTSTDADGPAGEAGDAAGGPKTASGADRPKACCSFACWFRRWSRANSISGWHYRAIHQAPGTLNPHPLRGDRLLCEYLDLRRFRARVARILPWFLVYLAAIALLMAAMGPPAVPYRGPGSLWADRLVLSASVLGMLVAIFYLADATRLCARLIRILSLPTEWGTGIVAHFRRQRHTAAGPADPLPDWIDIWVVRECSANLGKLMSIPFLMLGIMVLSRATFFDRWHWPWALLVAVGLNFAITFVSALRLRRAAEAARKTALENLNRKLSSALGQGETASALRGQIELMIRELAATTEGAFAPLAEQPIFKAILMPFSGAGLLALLDYLAAM